MDHKALFPILEMGFCFWISRRNMSGCRLGLTKWG